MNILAIANSQIKANGGSLVPLEGYADSLGVSMVSSRVDALPHAGKNRANMARYADDPAIVRAIQAKRYDYVLVTSRNSVWDREGEQEVFDGVARLHDIVVDAGAELALWEAGKTEFGVNVWMADKVHGAVLAQHATGALMFAFLTGRDPTGSAYRGSTQETTVPAAQAIWAQHAAARLLKAERESGFLP
ncbi:MAG: hypothetical protein JXR37_23475 [Kiritimatiellae bacterium]|nr:hypothetical protein [Kiritimatiellia bacterium]